MTETGDSKQGERIAKVMARAGLCSRREAEAWIAAGRVAINGTIIASPGVKVTGKERITVDGAPLPRAERTRLFLFHKPRGLVTTNADPENRPTIFGALPKHLPRLISVGRLDLSTEGLLLLTNDGGLARVLELPETGWLRRYRVRAHGRVTQDQLDALRGGVTIDGIRYGAIEAAIDRDQGANQWLTFAIREGKNREVRTVLEHLGLKVARLIRVSFGPFQLGELPPGATEEIKTRHLREQLGERIAEQAGCDFAAPLSIPPPKGEEFAPDLIRGGSHQAERSTAKRGAGWGDRTSSRASPHPADPGARPEPANPRVKPEGRPPRKRESDRDVRHAPAGRPPGKRDRLRNVRLAPEGRPPGKRERHKALRRTPAGTPPGKREMDRDVRQAPEGRPPGKREKDRDVRQAPRPPGQWERKGSARPGPEGKPPGKWERDKDVRQAPEGRPPRKRERDRDVRQVPEGRPPGKRRDEARDRGQPSTRPSFSRDKDKPAARQRFKSGSGQRNERPKQGNRRDTAPRGSPKPRHRPYHGKRER